MSTETPKTAIETDVSTIELPVASEETDGNTCLTVPDSATDNETAALAACLGAYLRDRQAQMVVHAVEETESANSWTLAGRYGCRCRDDLPRSVDRGEEWKMADRTAW